MFCHQQVKNQKSGILISFKTNGRIMKPQNNCKTGYDIRTDILKMATEIAIHKFDADWEYWKLLVKSAPPVMLERPNFPTMDEILDIAISMNEFVARK